LGEAISRKRLEDLATQEVVAVRETPQLWQLLKDHEWRGTPFIACLIACLSLMKPGSQLAL